MVNKAKSQAAVERIKEITSALMAQVCWFVWHWHLAKIAAHRGVLLPPYPREPKTLEALSGRSYGAGRASQALTVADWLTGGKLRQESGKFNGHWGLRQQRRWIEADVVEFCSLGPAFRKSDILI